MRVCTIGHGTRTIDDFLDTLRDAGIGTIADVRSVPGSRRHPQFGQAALLAALERAGIGYRHLRGLGGRRAPRSDSPHRALIVDAFRGYADHMATAAFARDLERLETLARQSSTAYLCAETLWWRCHRRMLSDLFTVRGWEVRHLLGPGKSEPHRVWEIARVVDGALVYDGGALSRPLP